MRALDEAPDLVGMNQVAGGFLGDLGGSIDFWRNQGRRASRRKITYSTRKFYAGR
jgi:hypothetical protein